MSTPTLGNIVFKANGERGTVIGVENPPDKIMVVNQTGHKEIWKTHKIVKEVPECEVEGCRRPTHHIVTDTRIYETRFGAIKKPYKAHFFCDYHNRPSQVMSHIDFIPSSGGYFI